MYSQHSSYLRKAFQPVEALVGAATTALHGVEYDTMIGSGTSGLLVIPVLARALNKKFAIVRKPNDNSHCETQVEGMIGARWIFVDDFVSTGTTRDRVMNAVNQVAIGAKYVGTYEYHFERYLNEISTPCACPACN